jgi:hypothetical protein
MNMGINSFWGRRYGGSWSSRKSKGMSSPDGFVFRGRRGAMAGSGNSNIRPKHYTSYLADNARAVGFMNGVRIAKATS